MAVAEYFAHWDIIYDFANGLQIYRVHTKALQIVDELGSTFQVELCHAGDLKCNLPRHCITIPRVHIFCLSSLQQNTDDSCFAKKLLHEVCFMQSSYKLCAQKAPSVFKFSHKIVRLKLPNYTNEGIPCVQPTYYLEGGSAQAYLKLHEVLAAVVYMFEGSTIQIWELFLCFERPLDQATLNTKQMQFDYKDLQFGPCYVPQQSEVFQFYLDRTKFLGCSPISDKLQGIIHIMHVSALDVFESRRI